MEVNKSQVSKLETQDSHWCSLVQRLSGSRHRKGQYFSSCLKVSKSQSPGSQAVRQQKSSLTHVKVRFSTDWIWLIHTGEGNLLYSIYQFKGKSENTVIETPRIMFG